MFIGLPYVRLLQHVSADLRLTLSGMRSAQICQTPMYYKKPYTTLQ